MRILVNTLAHVGGGGITYLKNMLPRFAKSEQEYVILVPSDRRLLQEPDADNIRFERVSLPVGVLPVRLLYEQFILPIRLEQWGIDVLFSPADLTPLLARKPTLLAIRNPNPYFSASQFGLDRPISRRLKFFVQRYLTKLSARKADHVFFVSDFSKDVSNEFLEIPKSKVSTIHHGIDPTLFENPSPPTDDRLRNLVEDQAPYLLTVSTVTEHKNYETLLRAYAQLPNEMQDEIPLLIAGRTPSEEYYERLRAIINREGIEDNVFFLGGVEYENIPYLYSKALAYVLPSKLETFGHTLVEAMAANVPIIAAESTCIPEITKGAAVLFDAESPEELADEIQTVIGSEDRRNELRERGSERVRDFSWDQTFQQTKELFERIISN